MHRHRRAWHDATWFLVTVAALAALAWIAALAWDAGYAAGFDACRLQPQHALPGTPSYSTRNQ